VKSYLGDNLKSDLKTVDIIHELQKKYNVFLLHKNYEYGDDKKVTKMWRDALGSENVLLVNTPKACVDVMLGVMAIISKTRTMKEYVKDMKERGQTTERIDEVSKALDELNKSMDKRVIVSNK
jgi:thymidylate synthase